MKIMHSGLFLLGAASSFSRLELQILVLYATGKIYSFMAAPNIGILSEHCGAFSWHPRRKNKDFKSNSVTSKCPEMERVKCQSTAI